MKSYFVLLLIASIASSSLYAFRTDLTREQKIALLREIRTKYPGNEEKQAEMAKDLDLSEEYKDLYGPWAADVGVIGIPSGTIRW